jgi:hypothetical protein
MVAVVLTATAVAAGAHTRAPAASPTRKLAGTCQFTGPIRPNPPITVVPKPGPHFSYRGTGTCTGTLDGAAIQKAPITVTFTNVGTAFDTCELGPDFNLTGAMSLRAGRRTIDFTITIDLARLALAGPFELTTAQAGQAFGTATFQPPNPATAVTQCGGSGVPEATLAANFRTTSPLVGRVRATRSKRRHHAPKRRYRRP